MLQWMGGSRRKVTTSRKSTHKRQKQYFEQRKRQQQQQQTAGLESYSDGKRRCTLQCDYSRSLDILSLENVSTVAQEHKTSTTTARDNLENDDFTLKDQDLLPSQVIVTTDGIPVDQSEINERTPSSYVTEAEYPEKVSVHLQNGDGNLVGNFNKLDSFKLSMSHQLSVIDLLGDDANTNAEDNSLRQECHVAFSVEGLGQVETETPVQSPKIPGSDDRSFLDSYSPPKKAVRVPITSKHLDYGFHDLGSRLVPDTVMSAPVLMTMLIILGPRYSQNYTSTGQCTGCLKQDIDFSPCGSTIDQSFCTRDMMNATGNSKQDLLNFRRPSPYNWNCYNVQGVLGNDDGLYEKRDSRRRIWEGPSFLDDGFDDLGEQESFCTNSDGRDVGFDDYFHPKSLWKQDLDFEGWDLNMKRSSIERPETYNVKESPGPYLKHITVKDLHGIGILDQRWRSGIEINNDVKDNNSVTEDSRERSLLSEESCSSTAVRVLRPRNHNNWS